MMAQDATSPLSTDEIDTAKAKLAIVVWLVEPVGERAAFMQRRVKSKFGDLPILNAAWYAAGNDEEPHLHAGISEQVQARISALG